MYLPRFLGLDLHQSGGGKRGRRSGPSQVYPRVSRASWAVGRGSYSPRNHLGRPGSDPRGVRRRGSCPRARPTRLAGHPPIASLLPPHLPSPLAADRFVVAWPGPHPFPVPLLRSLTLGTRCSARLADVDPVPQILVEGLDISPGVL